jgi:hypothetical protein
MSWTKSLLEEHKSREHHGKRGRPHEKPERRVFSLSGSNGAEKQESHCESRGAHVLSAPLGPFQGGGISP